MPTNLKQRIAEMKASAEKARGMIPSPWGYDLNGYIAHMPSDDEEWGETVTKLVGQPWKHAIGEHIAKCDPDSVLALIAKLERLQEFCDEFVFNESGGSEERVEILRQFHGKD